MKLHDTVWPQYASVDSANNLRHTLWRCSYIAQPDPMVVGPSKLALLSSAWNNNLQSYTNASCTDICSNVEWKSQLHHTTLHRTGVVPYGAASFMLKCIPSFTKTDRLSRQKSRQFRRLDRLSGYNHAV